MPRFAGAEPPVSGDLVVVYAHEEPPVEWDASVFLAGPTPRDPGVASWRPEAISMLRAQWAGARRTGGQRHVPLLLWRTASFQRWYCAQAAAGNALLSARVVWTFRVGPTRRSVFYWAAHVQVHVAAENRVKANEVVISRPDLSVLALYRPGATADDSTVVLVREFRSAASGPDGFVHELPGGSAPPDAGADADPAADAAGEAAEETGLSIAVSRIRAHGSPQLAPTMSSHRAHLISAQVT